MQIWHDTADTSGAPARVHPGTCVRLAAGTSPIGAATSVWLHTEVTRADGSVRRDRVAAVRTHEVGASAYWRGEWWCNPGDRIAYRFCAEGEGGAGADTPWFHVRAGPALHVALIWHHHQPALNASTPAGRPVRFHSPWVRFHALRDYAGMAVVARQFPDVHLTFNLTPCLLRQVEEYADHGATDEHLQLTISRAETLSAAQRERLLQTFFDADWHHQVLSHPRYAALFARRRDRGTFSAQDIRDLQMWSNLAWFAEEFREGEVDLPDGAPASVQRFVMQAEGFSHGDVLQMVATQRRILRAVIPLHRELQDSGQVEVSTTACGHPLLPLRLDAGTVGDAPPPATSPVRVAHPEDAILDADHAIAEYRDWFGCGPRGLWPADGAVSAAVLPLLRRHGIQWVATGEDALARPATTGYRTADPDALCTPYQPRGTWADAPALLFRANDLACDIGVRYGHWADPTAAAAALVATILTQYAARVRPDEDRLLTILLDGENAWGAYDRDGRPFLRALYDLLATDPDLLTVTPAEYIGGNPGRGVAAHPRETLPVAHELFPGCWGDPRDAAPGVDLDSVIDEREESAASGLLRMTRQRIDGAGGPQVLAPRATQALLSAEGSDWFGWLEGEPGPERDASRDALFRSHLSDVVHHRHRPLPKQMGQPVRPAPVSWSIVAPVAAISVEDRLCIESRGPARLAWSVDAGAKAVASLLPAATRGPGEGLHRVTIGPFPADATSLRISLRCASGGCNGRCACSGEWLVSLVSPCDLATGATPPEAA